MIFLSEESFVAISSEEEVIQEEGECEVTKSGEDATPTPVATRPSSGAKNGRDSRRKKHAETYNRHHFKRPTRVKPIIKSRQPFRFEGANRSKDKPEPNRNRDRERHVSDEDAGELT